MRSTDPGLPRLLLDPADAAAALGVGKTTLWGLLGRQSIRSIRIGRAVRIPVVEIEAFIQRQLDDQIR